MKNCIKGLSMLLMIAMFFGCSKDDSSSSCTPIACLNGGVSTPDCGCDCPIGFTGPNCSTQVTPTKILITKIKVKNFPNKKPDGVTTWDDFIFTSYNSPDIFPFLTLGSITLFQGSDFQDAISNGNGTDNFTWIPSTPIEIVAINSQFSLDLYDKDIPTALPPNEFMGGWYFYVYNPTGGFPTTKTVGAAGPVTFELTLSYVW
jgi:hypothetical protein